MPTFVDLFSQDVLFVLDPLPIINGAIYEVHSPMLDPWSPEIVRDYSLQTVTLDAASYKEQTLEYFDQISSRLSLYGALQEDIDKFKTESKQYLLETIMPSFSKYDLYKGKSLSSRGMIVLVKRAADRKSPATAIFWKDGIEMK